MSLLRLTYKGKVVRWRDLSLNAKTFIIWAPLMLGFCWLVLGCSLKIGGASFCFLDHADLTVTTHHAHADPNAN